MDVVRERNLALRKIVIGSGLVRQMCVSELCKAASKFQIYITQESQTTPLSLVWYHLGSQVACEGVGIVVMPAQLGFVYPLFIRLLA